MVLKGSAYEIGYQHGKNCRDKILVAIDYSCKSIKKNVSENKRREMTNRFLFPIEKEFPELMEELKGIAEGSGIDYQEILLLNFYEEMEASISKECTAIAFSQSDRGPLLGNNLDLECETPPIRVIETIYPQRGYAFISLRLAGTIWSGGGLNEKGLALGQASVGNVSDKADGINRFILGRLVLQNCKDVEEAVNFLAKHKARAKGLNYMLVDSSGNAAAVERSPTDYGVRRPENVVIYFTNFFLIPKMTQFNSGTEESQENPRERYKNLAKLVGKQKEECTLDFMKKILTDHHFPGAICRHGGRDINCTFYSLLAVPDEKRLFISEGNPCKNKPVEYTI